MPATETVHRKGLSPANRYNRNRWKRILFPLAAVLLAILPFVLLEGGLRVFGVGGRPGGETDSAGFGVSGLFELDEEEEIYETARHRLLFFGAQRFAAEKPPQDLPHIRARRLDGLRPSLRGRLVLSQMARVGTERARFVANV